MIKTKIADVEPVESRWYTHKRCAGLFFEREKNNFVCLAENATNGIGDMFWMTDIGDYIPVTDAERDRLLNGKPAGERKPLPYPKYMIKTNDRDLIVLFSGHATGTVIRKGRSGFGVGDRAEICDMSNFENYDGPDIVSNNDWGAA